MKNTTSRSYCPINFSLEVVGDVWSLLIVRDIIYFGKRTFNEFLASDEGIARNILADRLMQLRTKGLLTKRTHPYDKRKEIYELTDDGLELVPILLAMAEWGAKYVPQEALPHEWLRTAREHHTEVILRIKNTVRQGGSIFGAPAKGVEKNLFAEIKDEQA